MFKRIVDWFRTEFPPIKDPPPRESKEITRVTESVITPSSMADIIEYEKSIGLHEYQLEHLKSLRKFIKFLNTKELIGYEDHLLGDDGHVLSTIECTTYRNITIFIADGFYMDIHHYDMHMMGTTTFMSFNFYEVITAAAQGHLFDEPTVLRKAEQRMIMSDFIAYDKIGMLRDTKEKCEYFDSVITRTMNLVERKIANLPQMKVDKQTTPVFHKLWEQMELPLDTGTEVVKL